MSSETDDELALIIEVQFRNKVESVAVCYREREELRVAGIRKGVAEQYGFTPDEVWLVYRGKKIQDEESAASLVSRKTNSNESSPTLTPAPTNGGPPRHEESPFSGMLAQNPEMILELLQMNPKMKALMERNPQIRHALSDPSTLQEILATGSDPRVYQEAMRGHDRALANIENIPGGFQALQQFYTKELAEVETGMGEMHLHQRVYEGQQTRNVNPMPNPWKRSSMDNGNDETRFKEKLEAMRQMGFTDTQENIQALLACNGNVDSAIDKILSNRYL